MPQSRSLLVIVVLASVAAGCKSPRSLYVQTPAGSSCLDLCKRAGGTSDDVFRCVESCPGVRSKRRTCESIKARMPIEACIQREETAVASTIIAIVGLVVVAGILGVYVYARTGGTP